MSKRAASYQRWRPLLTDTLPYEVPVIFSNDSLFASVAENDSDQRVSKKLDDIRKSRVAGTKPYSYQIVKDRFGNTTLGLIHPISQMRMAEFYDSFAASITASCSVSPYSIRRPAEPAAIFAEFDLQVGQTPKQGVPHVDPGEGELDVGHITSYFTYRGYNLLSKFIDSKEFIRLEKKYARLRTIDISKCFFNIYTHSVSWAVKGKPIAKRDRLLHSFDSSFDALMQETNYKETSGIVIGPECSRIFAEIILQAADVEIERELSPLEHNREYAIRRYVDDYYVFAGSDEELDLIQSAIERVLEGYKLFVNTNKVATFGRPFVSDITLARRDARRTIQELFKSCRELITADDANELRRKSRYIVGAIYDLRMVVGHYGVGFHTLSGWLLGSLRVLVSNVVTLSRATNVTAAQLEGLADVLIALFELVSYVVALDMRVRTTYTLCQIAIQANGFAPSDAANHRDRIQHVMHQEMVTLVRAATGAFEGGGRRDSVELYNLLITACHIIGPAMLSDSVAMESLGALLSRSDISYFQYITIKFCFLQSWNYQHPKLSELNSRIHQMLSDASVEEISHESELFLIFCDYMSAPDVPIADKRDILMRTFGGVLSNDQIVALGRHLAFTDWHGFRVEHLLERKQLRPVYSWS